ncbi:DUF5063 domain-containing protein [Piscinibacter sp.]|jgi:hypothetical protein|uniref:DUF5063 domain-containing protein n=1 Tax=Piscinibacter sp. TaxID=1903157 RepID=UPI003559D0A0
MPRGLQRDAIALRFSHEARRFIEWADGSASPEKLTAPVALRRVLALYAAALELPQPWCEGVSGGSGAEPALAERLRAVRGRAAAIPLQHYSEIFSPLVLRPEEPVVGDLADDLVDIYRDVATGLCLYDAGSVDDAIWQWGFNFQIHWGEHASSAVRALHRYLSQEDPSGLSSDA